MNFDPGHLYRLMYKSRFFEEIISKLWSEGLISGEMHLGTGEEAIVASVVSNLEEGDSMALLSHITPPDNARSRSGINYEGNARYGWRPLQRKRRPYAFFSLKNFCPFPPGTRVFPDRQPPDSHLLQIILTPALFQLHSSEKAQSIRVF